ncbi:MAG TPA: SDR family NAD(P)-dependent oxidoreductase [Ktedonobacteraceae bacterium]
MSGLPSSLRRVALVTGAFSGIGEASALRLAKAGWVVYGSGRHLAKSATLSSLARAQGLTIHPLQLDVTDEASIAQAIQHIEQEAGRLDLLVNNAGFSLRGAVTDSSNAQIRQQFETNVVGLIAMTRAALPLMRRNHWGRVINMSSLQGKVALPGIGIYGASKFAVEGISDAMRLEWKLLGPSFNVVLIEPRFINTSLRENAAEGDYIAQSEALYGDYFRSTALWFVNTQTARAPGPDSVAEVVVKAAAAQKPKARYVVNRQTNVTLLLRRFLPDRYFDELLMSYSGLRKHLAERKEQ